jgi:hypothetical protein
MTRQLLLTVLSFMAATGLAEASNGFLCVGEQSTGFVKEGAEWKPTRFNEGKYVVVKATPEDLKFLSSAGIPATEWVFKFVGVDVALKGCVKIPVGMTCGNGDFVLNEKTLQFVYTQVTSYVVEMKLPKGVPPSVNIEIGKCSPF